MVLPTSGEEKMKPGEWVVSEYLDNGKFGILSYSGEIVIPISARISKIMLDRIVAWHNRELKKSEKT